MYFFNKSLFSTLGTNLWWFLWWKFLQRTLWTLERMPKSSPYLLMASAVNNSIKKLSRLLLFWSEFRSDFLKNSGMIRWSSVLFRLLKNSGMIRWSSVLFNSWRILMKSGLLINSYLLSLKADLNNFFRFEFWLF